MVSSPRARKEDKSMLLPNARFLVALAVLLCAHTAHADGFAVARHKSNAAPMDAETLRKAFSGRMKQWENGAVVQPVLIASEDAAETKFLAEALGMSARELLNRIQQEVFRGEMRRPTVIKSSAECVAVVRGNPGAFCVINEAAAATLPSEVAATSVKK